VRGKWMFALKDRVLGRGLWMASVLTARDLISDGFLRPQDASRRFLISPAYGLLYGPGIRVMRERLCSKRVKGRA